jgi:protein tyrosine phosphatase (PTP) superfamily phosphohydrolase (DUF442 family)
MSAAALHSIRNFVPLGDIATAGQPTAEQFKDVRDAGYDVVINLALPTSTNAVPNEREIVTGLGIDYVHIPVSFDGPAVDDARRFFDAMDAHAGRKVFVHCAMNMRVSAFMYLYRTIRQNVDPDDAANELHRLWVPNAVWQQFIDDAAEALGGGGRAA